MQFEDRKAAAIADRTNGVVRNDADSNDIVINYLLNKSRWSNLKIVDGIAYTLQHGDVKPDNIIWSGDSFTFIDLDNINYYPMFFDLLHFIASTTKNRKEAINLLRSRTNEISEVLEQNNINLGANNVDYIIKNYINWYKGDKFCADDYAYLIS